jgi:hypothetical protein
VEKWFREAALAIRELALEYQSDQVGVVLFGVLEDVADEIAVIIESGGIAGGGVWIAVMIWDVDADAGVVADVGQGVVESIEIGSVVFGKVQALCEILVQFRHGLWLGQVKDNFVNIHMKTSVYTKIGFRNICVDVHILHIHVENSFILLKIANQ